MSKEIEYYKEEALKATKRANNLQSDLVVKDYEIKRLTKENEELKNGLKSGFNGSPLHDRNSILKLMDSFNVEQMTKTVESLKKIELLTKEKE